MSHDYVSEGIGTCGSCGSPRGDPRHFSGSARAHRRYCLVQDNDSHWYIIPANRRQDWEAHCELDPNDEASWSDPFWAERIDGDPSTVHFENPRQTI